MDDKETKRLLRERKKSRKDFRRRGSSRKRVSKSWRRPHGHHSKVRRRQKSRLSRPTVGYRAPEAVRGLHPSGREEVRVCNMKDVQEVDSEENVAIRLSGRIGRRKKKAIIEYAVENNIHVLNPPQDLRYLTEGENDAEE